MGALAKGTLYFILVQLVFLASGYIIHAGLGRLLGPANYGIFGVVIALVTVFNLILISGLPRAASRYIAINIENAGGVKRASEKIILYLAIVIFLFYFLTADVIASLLGDAELAFYFRISAFIIPIYAFYALYAGFLNGLREYGKQAKAMLFYNIGKVAGVFVLVLLGFSVAGAIAGFALAPLAGFLVAKKYLKIEGKKNTFEGRELLRFAMPVIVFSVAFTALMSLDLFFVKRILADNVQVGHYTAASNLARIPFYILTAFSAALYPAVSKSISTNDSVQTRNYVGQSTRYLLILLAPIVVLIYATSEGLIDLFYSSIYLQASSPLKILVFGLACYTLFSIFTTVITASGKSRIAMLLSLILIPIAIILNMALIPAYGLSGAAIATSIVAFLGLAISAFFIMRIVGGILELKSIARVGIASLLIYCLALIATPKPILLPLEYLILFTIYLAILYLTREIGAKDIEIVKNIFITGDKRE